MTHTYAILEVSAATFNEVKAKLTAAEYHHAFDRDVIDMHGIALRADAAEEKPDMWRYRGPLGGWITVEEKPPESYDNVQALYLRPAVKP